ncbi:SEC-C metal-binding domain-containing protein [Butyrivibrio fibrisolvens]|uniref:SEC-C metal-binding domain-containing protein n=1 Tax=Pseudobutyrivibrio ruminis TaxID=46206 RepID=UPI000410C8E7|nr:SEC-C metal-binding domain-containing protein [Pseudobutyrivibrio ruminis]MDC7278776.1 SEC-C metal-binding domain-containing protein [Butyrivibrio fibrisolvens]
MLLKDRLNEYKKDELLDIARGIELDGISKLKKSDLIELIISKLCCEDMMRIRFECLTDEELALFKKSIKEPQDVKIEDIMPAMQLYIYMLGGFDEVTDYFTVYDEMAEVFEKINDQAFVAEQKKRGWLVKCIHFFRKYYVVAPLEVIYQLYRLKIKDNIADMVDLIWSMPMDIIGCCIFPEDEFQINEMGIDKYLHTEGGLLVNLESFEDGEVFPLLREQVGKDFYIPSAAQLNEIVINGYESSSLAYKKLKEFFKKKLKQSEELAINWCMQVWLSSYNGDMPTEVLKMLDEAGVVFDSEEQMNELVGLMMAAHNNTRLRENRGHKPTELAGKEPLDRMPTIVPGSTKAAAILGEIKPQLENMGMTVEIGKKVYPNDPCPCGSGKKYKKCCGR